ncbi:dnaJ homolog subfamily C member 5G [Lepus europaeus]|uniref:dnaJ homolog subfamily C member 5G n=1 Tax=Lepus europaeus TaxID=9983 RepID=UPI002B46E150|nr:dnaJ homolog subfamily C member 5G [Lepus europaeus]
MPSSWTRKTLQESASMPAVRATLTRPGPRTPQIPCEISPGANVASPHTVLPSGGTKNGPQGRRSAQAVYEANVASESDDDYEDMAHVDEAARRLSKRGSTLYAVLELKKGAPAEDVKKAYRRLALQYHPDKNPGNPQAAEIFKEINTAHSVLSDPKKRKIYDQHGSFGIYLYDHFGEEGVRYYYTVNSCWFKVLTRCGCPLLPSPLDTLKGGASSPVLT